MKPMYLARACYPSLSFTIGRLARRITKWSIHDDEALIQMYMFLESHSDYTLKGFIDRANISKLRIDVYPDADWAGDPETVRSTSGMHIQLSDGINVYPLEWASKRQSVVSCSTPEAELVSLARAVRMFALSMQTLLTKLYGVQPPMYVHEDNSATILILQKGYSPSLSHLERTHKINIAWTCEVLKDKTVHLVKIASKDQLGDFYTKPLDKHILADLMSRTGLTPGSKA